MQISLDFSMDDEQTVGMDSLFLILSMQIAEDYQSILRHHVMPEFKSIKGVNLREMRVLRCLARERAPLTGADVADRLRYDPATVTRAVKRLEMNKHILRRQCLTDHRCEYLEATESGQALAQRFRDQFRQIMSILSDMRPCDLSDTEIEHFVQTGRKLSRRLYDMQKIKPVEYAFQLSS